MLGRSDIQIMTCLAPRVQYAANWDRYLQSRRYQGEFVDGRREGRGVLIYANGDTYDGEWINNLFHGGGIFNTQGFTSALTLYRGQRYEGAYKYGKKHGHGIFHVGDGGIYDGYFEDNLQYFRVL